MEREFSAGGAVVCRREGRWWLAVIEPQSTGQGKKYVTALPKGLVDRNERPEQAAVREVKEETGVDAELIAKLSDIRYMYVRSWGNRQRVFKVVSFYLLRYQDGEIGDIGPEMRIEVRRAAWLELEEAPRRLTHRGEREVARLALDYVAAHPELESLFSAQEAPASSPLSASGRD